MNPTRLTPPHPTRPPTFVLVALLSVLVPAVAAANAETQPAVPAPHAADAAAAAMAGVADLAGVWEGEGWMRQGPGEPVTFHSRETVESRLDGHALLIEGLHHARTEDGGKGPVVHHALALLTWDEGDGEYDFRTYVAGRGPGDFTGRLEDGAFVWGGETPMGHMRYVIRIEGDTWDETGELSRDGETWMPFFGMKLQRVGE